MIRHRALIVEPSRVFINILKNVLDSLGVESCSYSSAKDALDDSHSEYSFIIIARTLDSISGDIFLNHFEVRHGLGNALTILLVADDSENQIAEEGRSGFKLVVGKNNIVSLQEIVSNTIEKSVLDIGANVLLVEDSKNTADLISLLLVSNGSKVQHISSLVELPDKFNNNEFDLIISDYYLNNGENGDDLITYVRTHECGVKSNIPILIVTGEINQEKRLSFLKNGANDVIKKPFDADDLMVRSSNLVRSGRLLTRVKKQEQKLIELALTDQLTSLYNRHTLYSLAPKYVSNSKRHKTALSILVIDLDHFKKINDSQGHSTGDLVLQSVAQVLRKSCRAEDMVARFGGEEFVMLLTNCKIDDAVGKAERLRADIEALEPAGLVVTASIGASELGSEDAGFESLFERGDKAVYEAKENGRNRVVASRDLGSANAACG